MNILVPVLIVMLVLAFSLVGFLYFKEQQKLKFKERMQKIRDLDTKIAQIKQSLRLIPPRLLGIDLRSFLVDQWLIYAKRQKTLEASYDNSIALAEAREAKENIRNNIETDEQKAAISDIEIASSVRKSLRNVHQILAESYRERVIDAAETKKYLNEVKKAFTIVIVEVYYSIAGIAVRNKKYDVAAAQYDKILQELAKNNINGMHNEDITKYRKVSIQLKEKAMEMRAEEEFAKPQVHETSTLEKQFDKMMQAEDEWKKRSEY